MMKRILDIMLSAVGLVILAPLLLAISIAVALSGWPVIYRGERVGLNGRRFYVWKFRTMVRNAEALGGTATAGNDPRITGVGRFLRRSKFDEFPQLVNVLRGEMSIVGPRPEVPQYVDMFTDEERIILSVRPGITDLASLWDVDEGALLAGHPDPEEAYLRLIRPQKLALQMQYVRERSLWLDVRIIVRTALAVLRLWVDRGYGRSRSG